MVIVLLNLKTRERCDAATAVVKVYVVLPTLEVEVGLKWCGVLLKLKLEVGVVPLKRWLCC